MSLLSTTVQIRLTGGESKTVADVTSQYSLNKTLSALLEDGTGANQAQKVASIVDTTTTSYSFGTTSEIDLAAIAGPFGTVNFSAIKIFALQNTGATNPLVVGNASATPFLGPLTAAGVHTLPPGALLLWVNPSAAGWSTSGATLVRFRGSGGSTTFEFHVVGEGT